MSVSGPALHTQFIPVRLRNLEAVQSDLLVLSLFEEERPPGGLAGLVDWRLDGLVSRNRLVQKADLRENPYYAGLVLGGFPCGFGEKLLFPISHKLPFSTAMVMGLGPRSQYTSARYRQVVDLLMEAVSSLRASSVTLRLPGWIEAGLPARRAVEALMQAWQRIHGGGNWVPGSLTFVEDLQHQAEMAERIEEMVPARTRQ
jgi:hypothetical protein